MVAGRRAARDVAEPAAAVPAPAVRVELLGRLRLLHGARAITRFRTRRTGALLGWLALHRGEPQPREELAERFWPDAGADSGRASLRKSLSSLRGQLEPPGSPAGSAIAADRDAVAIEGRVATDVA